MGVFGNMTRKPVLRAFALSRVRAGMRWCIAFLLVAGMPVAAQTLPALIDGVLGSHPSLRSQVAQGNAAKQAVEGAQWQFYPTPSVGFEQVSAGAGDPSYPNNGDKNVTTLRLQQPLWTGGRLTAGLDKAEAGVLASQAALQSTRQELAVRVVQLYSEWYGAFLKRQALDKSLEAHETLRAQILRRIHNGVSPQSDLTLLVGRQQQTGADHSAARAQEQTALGRLSQMLGHGIEPQALAQTPSSALTMDDSPQSLMEHAQTFSPSIVRLQAQARMANAEISERKADLSPEVYLRAERQYGNYAVVNSAPVSRFFVGFSSRFGAGLSSLSQVGGAQARYEAAMADIDSTRVSLGEQIQADLLQAETGKERLAALQSSLNSSDKLAKAWGRQFVAGRKTWLDVMNAVREQAQLETQIADARASQLMLTWRLAIVGRGLDSALVWGHSAAADPLSATRELALTVELPVEILNAFGQAPLAESVVSDVLALRLTTQIEVGRLRRGVSQMATAKKEASLLAESDPIGSPTSTQHNKIKEGAW